MNLFFQGLLTNTPVFVALAVLFFMIKKQGFQMEQGFKNVENEFKLVRTELRAEMREGFLKVYNHLKHHDREIRQIKKKLKGLKKQ